MYVHCVCIHGKRKPEELCKCYCVLARVYDFIMNEIMQLQMYEVNTVLAKSDVSSRCQAILMKAQIKSLSSSPQPNKPIPWFSDHYFQAILHQ